MKHLLIQGLILWMGILSTMAQECDVPMRVIAPPQVEASQQRSVTNKLEQIIAQNGIVGNSEYSTLGITTRIDVVDKHVISGPPMKVVLLLNVSLYLIDVNEEKIFATYTAEIKGVGNSEQKAFINAINQLKPANADIQSFMKSGKQKIIAYFDANYPNIITQSQSLAARKEYKKALAYVMSVPVCCKGYPEVYTAANEIYQQYINHMCQMALAKAKTAWVSNQDATGAENAAKFLQYIYPDADCYPDGVALYEEIKSRIKENWQFEMKKFDTETSLETQRIDAMKEVGVAYGEGQKDTTNLNWLK